MRNSYLFILISVLVCAACKSSKQVQSEHHTIEHTVDTMATQANTSTHTAIDSIGATIGGTDIVVDVIETTEHFDSLGRVTQKTTKKTNIHRKDSTQAITNQHTIVADTSQVIQIQASQKDSDTTVKEKKKSSWGSTILGGAAFLLILALFVYLSNIARKIVCKM